MNKPDRPAKLTDDVHADEGADGVTDGQPKPGRRRADSGVPAVVSLLIAAASARLDVVEQISDDAHDTVEKTRHV